MFLPGIRLLPPLAGIMATLFILVAYGLATIGAGTFEDSQRGHGSIAFRIWYVLIRALGGTRTPNLLIRSQMLYPLSYKRMCS